MRVRSSRTSRAAALAAIMLLCGLAASAPIFGQSRPTVGLTIDLQQPTVGDQIHLESDALETAPFNRHAGRLVLWVWMCPDTLENCRRNGGPWRRAQVRTDSGALTNYECVGGHCDFRFRLEPAREGTVTFLAQVRDTRGRKRFRSAPLEVTWRPAAPQGGRPLDTRPSLTLTVEGVSCTARFGENNNHCEVGRPTGDPAVPSGAPVIIINPDGSARAPTATASFTGYPEPQWGIQFTWQSKGFPCDTNLCTPQLTGWDAPFFGVPPSDFVGRLQVIASVGYDEHKGVRGDYGGTLLESVQATIWVDYRAPGSR